MLTRPAINSLNHSVDRGWSLNDTVMSLDVEDAWTERQDQSSNGTNLFDSRALAEALERLPRSNLDNPLSRPIRKHRNQAAKRYRRTSSYRRDDLYHPHNYTYDDRDDDARATRNSRPSRHREISPVTLTQTARSGFVAAMADIDFKEERDDRREDRRDDRRDRGGYRGNNKRRRDGKFATSLADNVAQSVCVDRLSLGHFMFAMRIWLCYELLCPAYCSTSSPASTDIAA
jgi:hypothetical protein